MENNVDNVKSTLKKRLIPLIISVLAAVSLSAVATAGTVKLWENGSEDFSTGDATAETAYLERKDIERKITTSEAFQQKPNWQSPTDFARTAYPDEYKKMDELKTQEEEGENQKLLGVVECGSSIALGVGTLAGYIISGNLILETSKTINKMKKQKLRYVTKNNDRTR